MRQKANQFRKQIRKKQIQSIFREKRLRMVDQFQQENEIGHFTQMQAQSFSLSFDVEYFSVQKLMFLFKMSTEEQGIRDLKNQDMLKKLSVYLDKKYVNKQEQNLATLIISNMLFIADAQPPKNEFVRDIVILLDIAPYKVRQNCLYIIFHLAQDYEKIRHFLINEMSIIEKLTHLFNYPQKKSVTYVELLLKVFYKITAYSDKKYPSFLFFKKCIYKVIINSTENNLIILSIYCLYNLLIEFHKQKNSLVSQLKNGGIIEKIINLTKKLNQRKIIHILMQIIHMCIAEFGQDDFRSILIPFIRQLKKVQFQVGHKSNLYPAQKIKARSYRIIFEILQNVGQGACQILWNDQLSILMLQQFGQTCNKQIIEELGYIFGLIMSFHKGGTKSNEINTLIERSTLILKEDFNYAATMLDYCHLYQSQIPSIEL